MQIISSEASSCIKCWQFLSTEMKETNSFAFVLLITISLGVMKPACLLRHLPAYINCTNIYRLKHRGSLYQKRYGTLEKKKKSLWHIIFAARYPESAQTICPLASANVFKERCPGLTVYFAGNGCWSLLQEPCGWHFFFLELKIKFPKICMHLMDCYAVNTFHLLGHPCGVEEVYPVVVPNPRSFRKLNWTSWKIGTAKPQGSLYLLRFLVC